MYTDLKNNTKIILKKIFSSWWIVLWKNTDRRRNYLLLEPNYHTTKFWTENVVAIDMEKIEIFMNKPVYLGLSVLGLSKILIYEFWYNYVKPKYGEKAKLCYMIRKVSLYI